MVRMSSGVSRRPEGPSAAFLGDEWVVVGVVRGPHGIRGEVKVAPTADRLERLGELTRVTLALRNGKQVETRVQAYRPYEGKGVGLMIFEGYADRTAAETLRGARLLVPSSESPPLPEGEYYEWQLIGLQVITTDGRGLGVVEEILQTGANDVYVTAQCLVPATADVIKCIDLEAGKIIVEPMAGLLND